MQIIVGGVVYMVTNYKEVKYNVAGKFFQQLIKTIHRLIELMKKYYMNTKK